MVLLGTVASTALTAGAPAETGRYNFGADYCFVDVNATYCLEQDGAVQVVAIPDRREPRPPRSRCGTYDRPMTAGAALFERLDRIATGRAGVALLAAWGFGEATVLPIVPDVLLYVLAAAAPRRAFALFAAAVAGALAGSAVLYAIALAAPSAAEGLVVSVPGIDRSMVDAARQVMAGGDPRAFVLLGPGTPLKVDTVAWASGSGTSLGLLGGIVLNRLTRIGPGLVLAALVGSTAPGWLRRHERGVVIAYVVAWVAFYAIYLS